MIRKDLTGKKVGKLTVLRLSNKKPKTGKIKWVCQCDCGNIVEVFSSNLIREHTKSCGCLSREKSSERMKTNNPQISELANEKNIKYDILLYRINKGWNLEDAVSLPKMKGGQKYAYRRSCK